MVYSSVPLYLDPPNWQQQHPNEISQISPQVLPPPADQSESGGGALFMGGGPTGATRPSSSMADRARQAKIPVPEGPLKCPRCDSPNTKFCYFNNYSLSQPRHFCKTCRRYWTRGGSLRSVPVGGGCRRNKRKKSGRAPKSPSKAGQLNPPSGTVSEFGAGHHLLPGVGPTQLPPFSFMASLQSLTQLHGMGNLGLNFGALGANNSDSHNLGNYGDHDELGQQQGQPQQLSNLLAGFGSALESSSSMYPFQNVQGMETASFGKGIGMGINVPHHLQQQQQSVKMEGMMGAGQQHQFWSSGSSNGTSGGMWTDLSGICSSSTATHNILSVIYGALDGGRSKVLSVVLCCFF